MPHQCTTCGNAFPDGSKEMLSGCPECGGTAFQFYPKGADIPDDPPEAEPPTGDSDVSGRVGRAATSVKGLVGTGPGKPSDSAGADTPWPDDREDDDGIIVADETPAEGAEDTAQSAARADLAEMGDLSEDGRGADSTPREADAPAGTTDDPPPSAMDGRVVSGPSDEQPGIDELREQLNDQFESIRIVEPGEYELNLMELYDREEYIIALQENGRYVIQMPETWMSNTPDED